MLGTIPPSLLVGSYSYSRQVPVLAGTAPGGPRSGQVPGTSLFFEIWEGMKSYGYKKARAL
ncbi:hypothetical protein SBF1_1670003 [Candidatus Desulfosporosinus infrequens]|uniref:Uncharacterized protein n=1 Tax=Candidatus Desulfosporosinus infrequens TaxID=2043169 RepID=A0A2U3KAS0_9FIRM|nr:hypothetical protein SBF1_1670003 [Candidatus Desulfosporosinus infrequens]